MIFTKSLDYEEILAKLDKDSDVIALIGCEVCVRVAGSGGESVMRDLALKLRGDGYDVRDGFMIPTSCTPKLLFVKLHRDINTILSLSCGAGTANVKRLFPSHKVVGTTENIGLMVADTDKRVLKVTMPYSGHRGDEGSEFKMFTGNINKEKILMTGATK